MANKQWINNIKKFLSRFSFRTGVIILLMAIPFYILSFAQALLPISFEAKGVLWIILFGLAKTTQYTGLAILGADGVARIKIWWKSRKKNKS